jgi:hypothetical protein
MLFYRQIFFILVVFFSLSSCNVTPLYKSDFKNELINNKIYVENIDTEIGFYLSQNLRFSLKDSGQEKRLKLKVTINTSERKYALSSDNEETRIDLNGIIKCVFSDGENIHEFVIKETVAYDVSESILANKAAERNAKKRLANLLSQAVLTELYHSNFDWIK